MSKYSQDKVIVQVLSGSSAYVERISSGKYTGEAKVMINNVEITLTDQDESHIQGIIMTKSMHWVDHIENHRKVKHSDVPMICIGDDKWLNEVRNLSPSGQVIYLNVSSISNMTDKMPIEMIFNCICKKSNDTNIEAENALNTLNMHKSIFFSFIRAKL